MKNPDLLKEVVPTESELKEIIVNYVGKTINPDTDEITVEDIHSSHDRHAILGHHKGTGKCR